MIDELSKAKEFYNLLEKKFHDTDHWQRSLFPIKFQTRNESVAFKSAFEELDEVEKDQWFDHHYHEAYNSSVFNEELMRGRQFLILLLKVAIVFELKPAKQYQFSKLIHACWIQPNIKFEGVKQTLKDIYIKAGFLMMEREKRNGKKNNASCGCLKTQCSIF